jgi:nucleoside-diphosphate-sugar epimerase
MVRDEVSDDVEIVTLPSDDKRSYRISSEKLQQETGFVPRFGVKDAIRELVAAFEAGKIPNPMTDIRYRNIQTMQELNLK